MEALGLEKNGKARAGLVKAFYVVCLLTLGFSYFIAIITCGSPKLATFLFFLFFAAIAVGLVVLISKNSDAITDRKAKAFTGAFVALMVALQLFAAYYFAVEPSWDFGGVFISAREYVERGEIITHEHYFERFYNNAGLLAIEIVYFKLISLFGASIRLWHGWVLNIIFMNAAFFFMILFIRKIWGNARALLYMAISLCFLPNILYAPVFYSDTLTMVFITLPLYLFACFLQQKKRWIMVVQLVSISLLIGIGAKAKATVLILLVAMIIYLCFNMGIKRLLASLLIILVPLASYSVAFDYIMIEKGIVKEEYLDEVKFPMEYWFYMGLRYSGAYNEDDFQTIYAAGSYDEKQQFAREGIKERLNEYGMSGFLKHTWDKASVTYRDGGYYVGAKLAKYPIHPGGKFDIVRNTNENFDYFKAFTNAYNYLLQIALIIGMVLGLLKRKNFDLSTMMYLALFGLCIFLQMWETRSRYLLNFTPVMIALAADSLLTSYALLTERIRKRKAVLISDISSNEKEDNTEQTEEEN